MAESPDWKTRLQEARQRVVFEPTPSGTTPYVTPTERLAEALDAVEVCGATAASSSPTATVCAALGILLRESINARAYAQNVRTRFEIQPDRVDHLCERVEGLLAAIAANGAKKP